MIIFSSHILIYYPYGWRLMLKESHFYEYGLYAPYKHLSWQVSLTRIEFSGHWHLLLIKTCPDLHDVQFVWDEHDVQAVGQFSQVNVVLLKYWDAVH